MVQSETVTAFDVDSNHTLLAAGLALPSDAASYCIRAVTFLL